MGDTEGPPVRRVSAAELRSNYDHEDFERRVASGEVTAVTRRNGHPSPVRSGQPECTRSQVIGYVDAQGGLLALVHQYLRPDGTIGGSGRPDPKVLLVDGELWTVLGD